MKSKGPRFFFSWLNWDDPNFTRNFTLHRGVPASPPVRRCRKSTSRVVKRTLSGSQYRTMVDGPYGVYFKKVVIPPWKINMETKAQNGGLEDYFIYFPFHMDIVLGSSR